MHFTRPLVAGRLVRRYKRFLADVRLASGETITAHCPNPGSMLGLVAPDTPVWLSRSPDPKRALAHTLEIVRAPARHVAEGARHVAEGARHVAEGTTLVGVNTARTNAIVREALITRRIAELPRAPITPEVAFGDSRVDFRLAPANAPPIWIEVKNVTLSRAPGLAEFPDSITARGVKHLHALARLRRAGARAVLVFVVQRADCTRFTVASDIDSVYAQTIAHAHARGVEVLCYACTVTHAAITLATRLPLALTRP